MPENKIILTSFKIIRQILPIILFFELLYNVCTVLIVKPILSFVLQIMLTISGYQIAFNGSILGFFTTIPGLIAGAFLFIISSLFIYFEFAFIIMLINTYVQGSGISLIHVVKSTIPTFRSLKNPDIIGFSAYAMGLLPIVNIGLSSTLLPELDIPNFITGELEKNTWGSFLIIGVSVLIFTLFLCAIFLLPVMVLEKKSFLKAVKRNAQLLKSSGKRLVGIYGGFLLIWGILYGLPKYIMVRLFNNSNISIGKIYAVYHFSWETILLVLLAGTLFVMKICLMPILLSFIVLYYMNLTGASFNYKTELEISTSIIRAQTKEISHQIYAYLVKIKLIRYVKKYKGILIIVVLIICGLGVISILNTPPSLHEPIVIGHRGSAYGVENTLESVQGGIDAGADYVEVDIQLSADGIPVVIHDTNLLRLSGENVNVYDLTASQLKELTLSQNGMEGKIVTLEDVVQYCQGKVGLAVELKLHGYEEENIVDQMMDVITSYNFEFDCIFISLEYDLVAELSEKFPECNVGYCLFSSVGNLKVETGLSLPIDFVVIEESMVTDSTLKDFRNSWLPVYVWTVDDAASMETYLEMGVIGIVSDYPDVAAEVVKKYNENSDAVYLDESEWR